VLVDLARRRLSGAADLRVHNLTQRCGSPGRHPPGPATLAVLLRLSRDGTWPALATAGLVVAVRRLVMTVGLHLHAARVGPGQQAVRRPNSAVSLGR
jgi:hypothetical protein